jgi:hypothetical protein
VRTIEKQTLTGTGTIYGTVMSPAPSTHFLTLSGKRVSGSTNITVTVEGGWDPNSTSASDWVDMGITMTLSSGNLTTGTSSGPLNEVRTITGYYRFKAVVASGSGSATIYAQFTES